MQEPATFLTMTQDLTQTDIGYIVQSCLYHVGSLRKLAEITGFRRSTLTDWLLGNRTPHKKNLTLLRDALNAFERGEQCQKKVMIRKSQVN